MKEYMQKKIGVLVILAVFFLGCAPATVQKLRENPTGQSSFETNENYQSVYRKIVTNARRCYQGGMITAQMVVQGDLYTDIKKGNVSIALHGGLGISTYANVDIEAITEDKTKVIIYYGMGSWEGITRVVEAWIKQGSDKCS